MEQESLVDLSLVFVCVNDHGVSCYPHFRSCIIYSSTRVASTGNADLFYHRRLYYESAKENQHKAKRKTQILNTKRRFFQTLCVILHLLVDCITVYSRYNHQKKQHLKDVCLNTFVYFCTTAEFESTFAERHISAK